MNGYLRQSTASQSRAIGPFVDDTDFKTAEIALTIANTDVKLRANGTTLANKNSGGGTHQVNGVYSLTFDATDTANVGELFFSVVVAGALPVFGTYTVLEEAVYDALFAASAAGFGTAQTGDSFARLGAPAGASVSADIASVKTSVGAVTGAVGSVTGAVGSVTGNVGGNVTGSVGSVVGAVGSVTGAVGSVTGNVGGNVVGSVGSLGATAKSDVNAEMLDVMNVDTYAEPGQIAPSATPTMRLMMHFIYKAWRNRLTQTSTLYRLFSQDTVTVDQQATVSDDGTTFTKGGVTAGP